MGLVDMACPVLLMASSAERTGRHSWAYRFTRVRPGPGGERLLAYHGAEIPYAFDTQDRWLTAAEADARLTTAMVGYWSNFARNGNPNGPGLAPWPAFDAARPRVLELGARISPIAAPDDALCRKIAGEIYPGWSQ
jgi:para-nitrobenzyl esterase